jgi:hypothetical protein
MATLLISSILVVPLLIARHAAGLRNPRRALRWVALAAIAFNVVYALSLVYLYFRLT